MLQIAAGTQFPQKSKNTRHGSIKFLDELERGEAEFVEVTPNAMELHLQSPYAHDFCFSRMQSA